jgi:hypothetical protein
LPRPKAIHPWDWRVKLYPVRTTKKEAKMPSVPSETGPDERTVDGYLATIDDEKIVEDSRILIDMMHRISGQDPTLWNAGTIGFGEYHYKYDSGREGDSSPISFYPRKGKITVYLLDGTVRHSELLARLGKHTSSRVCVYIKQLSDIELPILEEIARDSYDYIMSQDGEMHRALE